MNVTEFTNTCALARDIDAAFRTWSNGNAPSPSCDDLVALAEKRFGVVADDGVTSDLFEWQCDTDGIDPEADLSVLTAFWLYATLMTGQRVG